ncbi:MAG: hypothetical protein F6J90_35445 [Moorea sp. SIOASIH]|uniref:hypothetical protein n=1 Tax=Moorena sp. SIOASIH TaxID=2607817 RepID=UPI0013BD027D|nr:hypothetical protein [Moorena sp. SIOASIH]NEO41339.1 hypothetical protein [Moorena sp. SIOASIH]
MGETTAVAHGGNPQDRAASPRPRCIALIRFRLRHTEGEKEGKRTMHMHFQLSSQTPHLRIALWVCRKLTKNLVLTGFWYRCA